MPKQARLSLSDMKYRRIEWWIRAVSVFLSLILLPQKNFHKNEKKSDLVATSLLSQSFHICIGTINKSVLRGARIHMQSMCIKNCAELCVFTPGKEVRSSRFSALHRRFCFHYGIFRWQRCSVIPNSHSALQTGSRACRNYAVKKFVIFLLIPR